MKRVVVSGIGLLTPFGSSLAANVDAVLEGASAIEHIDEWAKYEGLRTRLGSRVQGFEVPERYPHKKTRSMDRVALLATVATENALSDAGLIGDSILTGGQTGIAYGSGTGSVNALKEGINFLFNDSTKGLSNTTYHRMMSHTCAANIGMFFGITGRILPTSSACTSGSLAIGYSYETIRNGQQKVMIAGGAEEFSSAIAAIFDVLCACSIKNETPSGTPSPFDQSRDGIVIGEAACTLILEEREHAISRGVTPLAEVTGFGTNSDGYHVTSPRLETVQRSIELALSDAQLPAESIDYVNAHATGTVIGDIIESQATANVFGSAIPISSLKGHFGHLLGGSGSTEAALSIGMLDRGLFAPTRNLKTLDRRCAELDYIIQDRRKIDAARIMSNTFAFGGVNTSLIFEQV